RTSRVSAVNLGSDSGPGRNRWTGASTWATGGAGASTEPEAPALRWATRRATARLPIWVWSWAAILGPRRAAVPVRATTEARTDRAAAERRPVCGGPLSGLTTSFTVET